MGSSLTLVFGNLSSKLVLQELKLSFKLLLGKGAILKNPRCSRAANWSQERPRENLRNLKILQGKNEAKDLIFIPLKRRCNGRISWLILAMYCQVGDPPTWSHLLGLITWAFGNFNTCWALLRIIPLFLSIWAILNASRWSTYLDFSLGPFRA